MIIFDNFSFADVMVITLLLCFGLNSCSSSKNYYTIPAFAPDNTVHAVIEIPAGTNKKLEYNAASNSFVIDQHQNQDRVIAFLPYPGNYGFIPSTLSDPVKGGDGDALDILVIAEALETGTVLKTIPIALLRLIDDGEEDYKILAIPAREESRIVHALSYLELTTNYPGLVDIMETWFLNYNPEDPSTIEGWGNETEAIEEIKKHLRTKQN
ncbi:inorganic diphosphatase [Ulvibacterium marinum]|uniref:inorganic diphosphatase n=1 Tax=Ulvibacterium marinum TaxID=2419782 RepID=UPI002495A619|nr:inorganic diphosphatase [Ulvibacterium marinum]